MNYFLIATLLILFNRQNLKLFSRKNIAIKQKLNKNNNENKTTNSVSRKD